MTIKLRIAGIAGVLALAACAPYDPVEQVRSRTPEKCEDAVSEGVGETQTKASRLAEAGARHQFDDVRGNLLSAGLKRIRVVNADTRCRPHTLGLGLVKCTATARLCGR